MLGHRDTAAALLVVLVEANPCVICRRVELGRDGDHAEGNSPLPGALSGLYTYLLSFEGEEVGGEVIKLCRACCSNLLVIISIGGLHLTPQR